MTPALDTISPMTLRQILTPVRLTSVIVVVAAIVTQAIVLANAGAFDPDPLLRLLHDPEQPDRGRRIRLVAAREEIGRDRAASSSCAARPPST